jgi:hypothetical protein
MASAAVTGRADRVDGSVALHAVARAFVLRHAVRFGARAAVLRSGERAYLDALAGALAGVRRVECIGTARDVRSASRPRLARARARAACAYLRARLPRTTVVVIRAAGRADRRDPDRRVDLLVRY